MVSSKDWKQTAFLWSRFSECRGEGDGGTAVGGSQAGSGGIWEKSIIPVNIEGMHLQCRKV